ncbi:uncharacterized protein LOC103711521 [Phoenix dactylifera]|uniref:Uncharacterized protein LOC103711521 n=1 Tax=Phoenix dactylifera TaxID=42345 RepID=A0A8B7CBU6_PHODC|nr:uncharacterized protein LOC103711521 [Phoenix dactylifera]
MELPVSDPPPAKDAAPPSHSCPHCDAEMVHKIAQLLLPGLATACVDATAGNLFSGPSYVAVDLRKEMVEYLTQRSQTYLAESIIHPDDADLDRNPTEGKPDDPADIVSDLMEDFASSKRTIFGRVSGWLLSDTREDKIDDFGQEMEMNRFWPIDRRESVSEILLRNLDFKNEFHCRMKFDTEKALAEHKNGCEFRPAECDSEGCTAKFCAAHRERHYAACPYRVVACEQGCPESLVRREMDRHCITVCPMRMVNCPFFPVGCQSAFPACGLARHCTEFLRSHLLCVLPLVHKPEGLSTEEMERRAQLLEEQAQGELSEALDVRSLTFAIKEQEAEIRN